MFEHSAVVRPVRNGSTVELYADVWRISRPFAAPAALALVVAGLSLFMSSRLPFSTLVTAAGVVLLTLLVMLPLAVVRTRGKPWLLFEKDQLIQNVPGGLRIRWTAIGKVDSLVTSHGTLVRLFVSDWPAFLSRYPWFARPALRWQRWCLGRSFAPLTIDPTHFGMTELELTALLRDFIPEESFVSTKNHETLGDEFWRDVRLCESVIVTATVGAAFLLAAERAVGILGILPPFAWSRFFVCVAAVFTGLHLILYAMLLVLLGVRIVYRSVSARTARAGAGPLRH